MVGIPFPFNIEDKKKERKEEKKTNIMALEVLFFIRAGFESHHIKAIKTRTVQRDTIDALRNGLYYISDHTGTT